MIKNMLKKIKILFITKENLLNENLILKQKMVKLHDLNLSLQKTAYGVLHEALNKK